MEEQNHPVVLFSGTIVSSVNQILSDLYGKLDSDIFEFQKRYNISCGFGCGVCCQNYEPEISQVEADYAATWILGEKRDIEVYFEKLESRTCCIFYNDDNPFHCTLYPVRPLLCRSFGFTGYPDKNGTIEYRKCKAMPDKAIVSNFSSSKIPSAVYYGNIVSTYNPGNKILPLSEAVFQSYNRLSLIKRMMQES